MKLTTEEITIYNRKKAMFYQTNDDIARVLGVDAYELYLATNGQAAEDEMIQAIREWIA